MNEPFANLNFIAGIAMTACMIGFPVWLLGALPGRLYLTIFVFFVGTLFLSNWADRNSA